VTRQEPSPHPSFSGTSSMHEMFTLYEKSVPELDNVFSEVLSELERAFASHRDMVNDIKLNLYDGFSDES